MSIAIEDLQLGHETHDLYKVKFHGEEIETLVTRTPSIVDSWISNIERIYQLRLSHLIVGLDVEWRPNFNRGYENPVSIIQLCVGVHCLVFQILHSSHIPQSLPTFLSNSNYTFVGVGINADVEKILGDYGLQVAKTVDLRVLAAEKLGNNELRKAGLKTIAKQVLEKEVEKPKRVTMSRWDNGYLTYDQVKYACVDAFLSFEIGRRLNA